MAREQRAKFPKEGDEERKAANSNKAARERTGRVVEPRGVKRGRTVQSMRADDGKN